MTIEEFNTWLAAHLRRFDFLSDKLSVELQRDWFAKLKFLDAKDVDAASLAIYAGDVPEPMPSGHLAALRRVAGERAAKRRKADRARPKLYVGGEEAYRCLLCRDSGWVIIWHPHSVEAVRNGAKIGDPGTMYDGGVTCTCVPEKDGQVRYDDRMMMKVHNAPNARMSEADLQPFYDFARRGLRRTALQQPTLAFAPASGEPIKEVDVPF